MAAHRYWRFYIRKTTPTLTSTPVRIYTLEFFDAAGTSLTQTAGGSASASSVNGTQIAANAFDASNATYWEAAAGAWSPQWVKWDFGAGNSRDVVEYRIYSPLTIQNPGDCTVEYSDDDLAWTPVLVFGCFGSSYDTRSKQPYVPYSFAGTERSGTQIIEPMTWAALRSFEVPDTRLTTKHLLWWEGTGRIASTVKVDTNGDGVGDANLRREVRLIDEQSMQCVKITWSNAVTGEYAFEDIRLGANVTYTVYAIDYERNYRAVIADNLVPSPMP